MTRARSCGVRPVSGRRTTTSWRLTPSISWATRVPSDSVCIAASASPGVIPYWAALRWSSRTLTCGIHTCRSTVMSTRPGTRDRRARIDSATPRSVSTSSPWIFSAICARTPDSRWSSRCEIGWPIATDAGSEASCVRMAAITCSRPRADGFRSTSISDECTPSACSSSSARPVRRPTCATSGTCRISASASAPIRLASASEVPGWNISDSTNEPSLNGGRNARGIHGTDAAAIRATMPAAASTARARGNDHSSTRESNAFSQRTSGLSGRSSRLMPGSR